MFRFHRSLPTISVFHNGSQQSNQVLTALRTAQTSPYPPQIMSDARPNSPLEFELSVQENKTPTADQIQTVLSYLHLPLSSLVSAHPSASSDRNMLDSPKSLADAASRNPNIFRYPLVVNWDDGDAAFEIGGVKKMLDKLAKRRDGAAEDDVAKPKGWFS